MGSHLSKNCKLCLGSINPMILIQIIKPLILPLESPTKTHFNFPPIKSHPVELAMNNTPRAEYNIWAKGLRSKFIKVVLAWARSAAQTI